MDKSCILVVDDEAINRSLLREFLGLEQYEVDEAECGSEALKLLNAAPGKYSAVLLDRMMPDMDGLAVLKQIKADSTLEKIPVIMQTAKARPENIQEGLENGCFYYLTKPFDRKTLNAVLKSALQVHHDHNELIENLQRTESTMTYLRSGVFECQNFEEARDISMFLAKITPQPEKVVTGLSELVFNSIEHGNLNITYDEKSQLMADGRWRQEIDKRLNLDENRNKFVTIYFSKSDEKISFHIVDCGTGFDFQHYISQDLTSIMDAHGRGIVMAKLLSFDQIEYISPGNEVIASINLNSSE